MVASLYFTPVIKQELYSLCQEKILERIDNIENRLASLIESRDNETKSSVGDKYETGRAMMQIEIGKSQQQLAEAKKVKVQLSQINPQKENENIQIGSLVETNKGIFYISIGLGKITWNQQTYFCISTDAPIAKMLFRKQAGDSFSFNGQNFDILSIQ